MLRYCLSIYQFVLLVLILTKKFWKLYIETQTTQTVDQYKINMLSIDRLYFMKTYFPFHTPHLEGLILEKMRKGYYQQEIKNGNEVITT